MGLDQYLHRHTRNTDVSANQVGHDKEVAYWRKNSQIQTFFASENCETIDVPLAQLKDLQHRVNTLLKFRANFGDVAQDRVNALAHLDLPSGSGFFWGRTDYDDRYWAQLEHTSEQLAYVIGSHTDGDAYSYCGDW